MIKIDKENFKIETDCKTVGEFMTEAAAIFGGNVTIIADGCRYEFHDNPKITVTDDTPLGSVTVERADSLLSGGTVLRVTAKPKLKTVRKSGFVNLYRGGILQGINCGYRVFASEQEAMDTFDMTADCEKFAVAKIEWEEVEQ
jgi:hypothetical protein